MPDLETLLGSDLEAMEGEGDQSPKQDAPPTPTYASVEDVKRIETILAQQQQQFQQFMGQAFDALAAARNAGQRIPEPEPEETINDEELVEAGLDPKVVKKVAKVIASQRVRGLEQKVQQLEALGLDSMKDFAKELALQKMPYYKDFQRDIDAAIDEVAKLNPAALTKPQVWVKLHDTIVGGNIQDIINREVEKRLRTAQAGGGQVPPTASGRQVAAPSGDDDGGLSQAAMKALQFRGWTKDQFAQRLGYADWSDYQKQTAVES